MVLREQHEVCLPGKLKGRSLLAMVIAYQVSQWSLLGCSSPSRILGGMEDCHTPDCQLGTPGHSKLEGKGSARA